MRLMLAIVATLAMLVPAQGRDDGQWGDQPPAVRQWFQDLMQPDNPLVSCCGEADAYQADSYETEGDHYVAIITDGSGNEFGKPEIPNGTRIPVPNHKVKWTAGNPTGHGVIFLSRGGDVYCFVPAGGV